MKKGERAKGLDLCSLLCAGVLKSGGVVEGLWTKWGRETDRCGG